MLKFTYSDDDVVSIGSSTRLRKRKRDPTPPSSDTDSSGKGALKPRSSATSKSNDATRKHKTEKNQQDGRNGHSQSTASTSKHGKSARRLALDSDSDSDGIVVASSKNSQAQASIRRPSPTKPSVKGKEREEKHKQAKNIRIMQLDSDEDEKDGAPTSKATTSSQKSSKPSSSKTGSATGLKKTFSNGNIAHMSKKDSTKPRKRPLESPDTSQQRYTNGLLDDYNFTTSKSPSPVKPPKPTNGDSVQDSVKIKRLQSQVEKEKRESQKWEDQFYEASAAAERLMVTIADLEHRLMQSKKTHQDDVARIKDRYEGDEDVERQAQVRQEKLEQKLMIVTNRHSEVTLALQRDLLRLQKELKEARGESTSRKPAWMQRAEMESVTKANQLERQLRQQKEEYEARIERLEREVALRSNNAQLAAKERELESIRLKYQQELDKRQYDYDKLKALYDLDKQAWHSYQQPSASGSGFAASEDTEQLQRQIATLTQQKKNTELHYQATMETYEAHIKRMQREAIEKHQKDRETISLLESARAGMEFDRARFQGQVVSLRREKDALQNTVDKFGRIRIDYDRLSDHLPRLQKDYDALKEDYETVKGENAALNEERLLIHATVKAAESKVNEYAALLQVGVAPFDDSYGALSEKYKLLKSTYSLERDQYKQKIKSLKEKLAAAQGDGTVPVYRNAARTAQVAAMSTSEDEDAFLPEADRRKRAKRQHDRDLQYDLFDDPVPLAPTRPLPSTILPRSPSPAEMSPAKTLAHKALQEQSQTLSKQHRRRLHAYEAAKPSYQFPPTIRERKADTKVPRHKNRVYVRSECHTPYVPDEMVSDSDDEFLEWESEAYAKSQAKNPDRKAALVNTCWNRHVLDIRCNRVRSSNLHFCIEFVESYGPLLHSKDAGQALLKHVLKLVDLGQLTADEGGMITRAFHQAV